MARKSDRDIRPQDDWSLDPRENVPYSGASVQRYIKQSLNSKVGAGLFDNNDGNLTIYLFKDQNDKQEFEADRSKVGLIMESIPLRFETTQYRIRITPDGSTTINVSVNESTIDLSMAIQAEKRDLGEPTWTPTNQDIGIKVYVDALNTGNYEEVTELEQTVLSSVGTLSVDIKPYIPVGSSRIRFYMYAIDDTSLSTSIVWTVNLAEIYIEEWGNTWDKPLIENISDGNYHFGGFRIVGNVSKTIHIEVSTASTVVAYYERDLIREYVETSYMFTREDGLDLLNPVDKYGESLEALSTGIYNVKVWLTSGDISTEDRAIVYNVIYIAPGDEYSARMVVMNNSGEEINNYDESALLCEYAIYNAGETYGVPDITITAFIDGTPEAPISSSPRIPTSEKRELRHSINLVTVRNNLTVQYRIDMDDNYQYGVSPINNTEIFPSVDGAAFYLNPSTRSNGEELTREIVYNTAGNSSVALASVDWSGMSWVDGIDGWGVDDTGRKCLHIPARTRLEIPNSSFNFFPGDNITIELCYKVSNVSDYTDSIISIGSNADSDGFFGLRVRPTNITVHSGSDTTSANDTYQGTNVCDEEVVHLVISIQRKFEDHDGFNIVTGYINGVKNFQFEYQSQWASSAAVAIFGSDTADLYLYMVRAYRKPLSSSGAEDNWLNSLVTRDEKVEWRHFIDSVLDSREISYNKIKNDGKYNFFVIEMTQGAGVPSKSYPDGGFSNIEMHYGADENGQSRSSWDWKIYGVETKGQGTTSMNYWKWNIRWRIDDKKNSSKKRPVAYYDTPVIESGARTFVEFPASDSKTVWFDGNGNHPAVKRITAKINFASSMQGHKMGATRAYNILHDSLLDGAMRNEAQSLAQSQGKPMPTVAVYQYPAYGFQRITDSLGHETYTFIGLFTIGPDKGDKPTFGYDLVPENNLVTLEGTDHHHQMTRFTVPWDEQASYYVNADGDGFLGTKGDLNAIEVGNAGSADTSEPSQAMPVLEAKFKNAYDVVYNNSTLIFPVALDDSTWGGESAEDVISNINAAASVFRDTQYNDRFAYSDLEFWIEGDYKLYHYEYESGRYVSGYKSNGAYSSPLDLRVDTGVSDSELDGLTLDEQNELFKQARRNRFAANAPLYWDTNELVFNYVFLIMIGATDNFAKNQYPYYMGGKWRLRQDDLDTVFDIDNNGGQTKPFYIEFADTVGGSPYFAGSSSILWNLVHESMWSDYTSGGVSYSGILSMGRSMIEEMSALSGGVNAYDGFFKFFEKYFWKNAQMYFTQSAYNIDGRTKYEDAWLTGISFSVEPLKQSLGNHYSAERLWIHNRALYCLSLFKAGPFGSYELSYLGSIQFRPVRMNTMQLTAALPMYPCLIIGDNDIRPTSRTLAGNVCEFTDLSDDGQATYTIQGVDNLISLGDLKDLNLGLLDGGVLKISGKRLRSIKLGDATETVTTNVSTLSLDSTSGMPCLEVVDLRNAGQMSGVLDLTKCKRIKEVYTEGTSVSEVKLPKGSKIEKLHLSDDVTTLSYQVIKYLNDLVLPSDASGITLIYLEECDALDGMSTLEEIYNTNGQSLEFIRLLWRSERTITGPQVKMLVNIMQNLEKDGTTSHAYHGVDPTSGAGQTSYNPSLEGKLLASAYYKSDIELLAGGGEEEDSEEHTGMKVIQSPYFGALYITYSPDNEYIPFADMDVVGALYSKGIGDGVGVTFEEAGEVTSFNNAFAGRTDISSFDEIVHFTSITTITTGTSSSGGDFRGCTSLTSIIIPDNITTVGNYSFYGCTSLTTLTFLKQDSSAVATYIGNDTFTNAPVSRINIESITSWMRISWANGGGITTNHSLYIDDTEVTSLDDEHSTGLPATRTSIGQYAFYRCNKITSVTITSNYTSIGNYAFANSGISGEISLQNVTSVGNYAFSGTKITRFVNTSSCTYGNWCFNTHTLEDIYVKVPSGTGGDVFKGAGSTTNPGTLYIDGSWTSRPDQANWSTSFRKVFICGSVTINFGGYFKNVREIHIGENVTYIPSDGVIYASASTFVFYEVLGNITTNTDPFSNSQYRTDLILHLGRTSPITASPAGWSLGKVVDIYIGDGSSVEADEAVIAMYEELPEWANHISKMKPWASYSGEFKQYPEDIEWP